jgi:hypothetical protein
MLEIVQIKNKKARFSIPGRFQERFKIDQNERMYVRNERPCQEAAEGLRTGLRIVMFLKLLTFASI